MSSQHVTVSLWDVITMCECVMREADSMERAVVRWDVKGKGLH